MGFVLQLAVLVSGVIASIYSFTRTFNPNIMTRTETFSRRLSIVMKDYPKPNVENTDNYREAAKLSAKFATLKGKGQQKKVAVIGGGLSGT